MSCSVATSNRPGYPNRLAPALHTTALALALALVLSCRAHAAPASTPAKPAGYEFDDSHFHLTNYIQEGITPQQFLKIMGTRVGRSTLFGIPLQQQWSYRNSGDEARAYELPLSERGERTCPAFPRFIERSELLEIG